MEDVVFLAASRTPIGSFLGSLSSVSAPRLGARAIDGALCAAGLGPDDERRAQVEQVIMGNVLQAGQGQAPARQAAIYAGLGTATGAITLHKVCGSGMRTIMDGANGIRAGEWAAVVAGGMESMSNAPHLLERSRAGFRMGDIKMTDSMVKDGLWDPYGDKHMGSCAELCATKYNFTRESQDAFALQSYKRAQAAAESERFAAELVSVEVPQRKGDAIMVQADEEPYKAPLDKMGSLRPAFAKDGTVTAANASKLNDGAAAVLLASASKAAAWGIKPLARVVSYASTAQEPEWFTTAPAAAVRKALDKAALTTKDIGLWEVNEAFAVVSMAAIEDLNIDKDIVNINGGAVALGHPIGCSGTRIVVTLLHAMRAKKVRYGCAAICIGGGEATAIIVENTDI